MTSRISGRNSMRRLPIPADPTVTLGGSGTASMPTPTVLRRWSSVASVGWEWLCVVTQTTSPAAGSWDWLTIPALSGFDVPAVTVSTSRTGDTIPQRDTNSGRGGLGAAPRGPFRGAEAAWWPPDHRVYLAYFRRDQSFVTEIIVRAEFLQL